MLVGPGAAAVAVAGVVAGMLAGVVGGKVGKVDPLRKTGGDERFPPVASGDWRTVLMTSAPRTRAVTIKHPWLVEASARMPNAMTPRRVGVMDRMLKSLDGIGLNGDSMMIVMRMVDAYARGAVAGEVNQRLLVERRGFTADGDPRQVHHEHMRWIQRSGRFPMLTRLAESGLRLPDPEAEYQAGLDCLIEGIAARYGI